MNEFSPSLIHTADGSHSLYVPGFNEHYHSTHGAIQESRHVFIEAGLAQLKNLPEVSIFEMGLGTGLNALLTLQYAMGYRQKINYVALEANPIDVELADELNYPELLDIGLKEDFMQMHAQAFNISVPHRKYFHLTKINLKLQEFIAVSHSAGFHLVFFDAFAPEVQPELWTEEVFRAMNELLLPAGLLVTYCSKGQVRRNMKAAGFRVEKLPGPKGKREMVRAFK